jgi:ribosomal protein S15P/S13E
MPKKSESKTVKKEKEETKPVKVTQNVFENKVIDLAKKGITSEKIGEHLRKEGIHPKEYEKKISVILKENNLYINPDLKNVETKLTKVKEHYNKNKQDKRAMREKDRIFAKFRKLKEHFKE